MANPVTTARGTPSGIRMNDGHSTKIAFAVLSNASFWEKNVGVPGIDGGEAINISNMHNTTWRTMVPRALKTLTPFTVTALWDPRLLGTLNTTLVNNPGSITVHFPDTTTYDFFGYLQKGEPQPHEEGAPPEIQLTIVPTNYDPVNRVEAGPVLTEVTGS